MTKNKLSEENLNLYANLLKNQKNQQDDVKNRIIEIGDKLNNLNNINENNSENIDALLKMAENIDQESEIDLNYTDINQAMSLTNEENSRIEKLIEEFDDINVVNYVDDWNSFVNNNFEYAENFGINIDNDPFKELLTESEQQEIVDRMKSEYNLAPLQLDKYDYLVASLSGILSGLIDVFFIGEPLDSKKMRATLNNKKRHENLRSSLKEKGFSNEEIKEKLKKEVDINKDKVKSMSDSKLNKKIGEAYDKIVFKFASFVYEYDKKQDQLLANKNKKFDNIAGAIGYLEKRFKVPYDARYAKDLNISNSELNMLPRNHHLKSLGHMPDIFGLFFSILDQFRHTTTVIDKGKIQSHITPKLEEKGGKKNFELQGHTFVAKILCGVMNWFGHLMSDLVGSSGTRGHEGKKGAGIPMPFYGLTQLMASNVPNGKNDIPTTFAKITEQVYVNGYDARFGATLAIPVVLNEMIIRLFWTIKQVYYHKKQLKDVFVINKSREIDRLLLVGHGTLCMVDGIDAFTKSGGGYNLVLMLSRMNLVGWTRFGMCAFKETVNLYKDSSNLKKLDKDLEEEWKVLFKSSI